jgi:hypothetical protein
LAILTARTASGTIATTKTALPRILLIKAPSFSLLLPQPLLFSTHFICPNSFLTNLTLQLSVTMLEFLLLFLPFTSDTFFLLAQFGIPTSLVCLSTFDFRIGHGHLIENYFGNCEGLSESN